MKTDNKLPQFILKQRERILSLCKIYHALEISLFGSYAKKTAKKSSDVDFLVKWDKDASLSDWSGLKRKLEKLLGKNVDISSHKSIHHIIRKQVLQTAIVI